MFIGDATAYAVGINSFDERKSVLLKSWIGIAPLVVRAYSGGVGTSAPRQ